MKLQAFFFSHLAQHCITEEVFKGLLELSFFPFISQLGLNTGGWTTDTVVVVEDVSEAEVVVVVEVTSVVAVVVVAVVVVLEAAVVV